ncbi:MAG: HD domain-containing protein [Treponema sp.]|nr:HD domain-containing protein [Treponema sp.]
MNSSEKRKLILNCIHDCEKNGRFLQEKMFLQHGKVSVYRHSINVALLCLDITNRFNFRIDCKSLVRGALLHDYFLYDWHTHKSFFCSHGFTHPFIALKNAEEDFVLTQCEKDIIVHHMFPLVPFPPLSLEGWVVCAADKICAVSETVHAMKLSLKNLFAQQKEEK